jgi:hypothetical protein
MNQWGRRSVFVVCLMGSIPYIGAKADDVRRSSAPLLKQRDKATRSRLQQGDLDSMVNFPLLGTSLPGDRFDLMVGTNIFSYYDAVEQRLALENGAMLNPGGLLLMNDRLPETRGGSMIQAGMTVVRFEDRDPGAREAVGWYRKQ